MEYNDHSKEQIMQNDFITLDLDIGASSYFNKNIWGTKNLILKLNKGN